MSEMPHISVVIPAYNEEECIRECVLEVRDVLRSLGQPFEIVVTDDGSRDRTFEELRSLQSEVPELRAIRFRRNCGQTAAMDAGFQRARGQVTVTLDADLQNDPADVPMMLEKLKDWDVVCGIRTKRADNWVRRVSSRVANWVRNRFTGEQISDVGCTLRAYRTEFLRRLKLFEGMHRFLPTLLRLAGARVTEVPVRHRPRPRGKAKYSIRNRLFRGLRDLRAVRWMQSRWLDYEIEEEIK